MPTAAELEEKLKKELSATEVRVVDTSDGCGAKFEVEIISSAFEGQKPLARHRLVNGALKEEMPKIHAMSIKKAQTPAEAGK